MKTKQKTTFLLMGAFLLFIVLLSSCVDVPTEGPTPPPLKAEYRFVHGAADMGEVSVSVDGQALGSIAFKGVLPHAFFASGAKSIALSNGQTFTVSMSTDYRGTFLVLNEVAGERTFLKLQERRMFDSASLDTLGAIRPVHGSMDAPAVDIEVTGPSGTLTWDNVSYRSIGAYAKVAPGDYTVTVTPHAGGDAVLTGTVTVGTERNTVFVVGSVAGGTLSALAVKDN